ncbi:TonB-dependent receptor family protein [Riemerella columbipharyngis]|uniref:Outer membrane receptor for Fe3+-dicitrate n=1 Tax=Riemerella columbipharyngis TaxID=1071918 RepID=A0A1G6ZC63_9FLAO|nr:TonB-dependent receptor [Riemerella columbipharyngis]SDD99326.1 Outer membrane receptor for Fe3+-dicitrate [Riemerella columbipharyngis]
MKKNTLMISAVLVVLGAKGFAQIKQDSIKNKEIKEVVITATGAKEKIKNYAGSVSTVSQKTFKELGIQSVGDAMRLIPGANFVDEDGRGIKPSIGLRGLDPGRSSALLTLIDGKIPLGESYSSMSEYTMVPAASVERIEIIRGASPVLYGGGSIGGVMNIITKSGAYDPYKRVYLSYGNYNSLNFGAEAGGGTNTFNYYVGYNRRQSDGSRKSNSKFSTDDFTVSLAARPDNKNEFKFYFSTFWENSKTPGGLNAKQYAEDPRQSLAVHDHDNFLAKRFMSNMTYTRHLDENNTLSAVLYGGYFQRDWWIGSDRSVLGQNKNTGILRNIPSFGTYVDYKNTNQLWDSKNNFLFGLRYHTDIFRNRMVQGQDKDARSGIFQNGNDGNTNVYEAYVYDQFYLRPDFIINPGLRYTYVKYGTNNLTSGTRTKAHSDSFIYSLGFVYQGVKNTEFYATLSKGYQPPSSGLATDPRVLAAGKFIKAETSDNYEIGVRTRPTDWLGFDLTGYLLYFNNKIVRVNGIPDNAGKSFHRGIEFVMNVKPTDYFSFYVNGSLQKATFSNGDFKGNRLPYAPDFMITPGAKFKTALGNGLLTINIYDSYTAKQYADNDNSTPISADGNHGKIPGYNILSGTINYDLNNINFNFNMQNILDREYFTKRYSYWGGIMPSSDRTFSFGVGYKF